MSGSAHRRRRAAPALFRVAASTSQQRANLLKLPQPPNRHGSGLKAAPTAACPPHRPEEALDLARSRGRRPSEPLPDNHPEMQERGGGRWRTAGCLGSARAPATARRPAASVVELRMSRSDTALAEAACARARSRVQTLADSQWLESLASRNACFTSWTLITGRVGPTVSSRMQLIDWRTSTSTVDSKNAPGGPRACRTRPCSRCRFVPLAGAGRAQRSLADRWDNP
jgi:hypothetical protein